MSSDLKRAVKTVEIINSAYTRIGKTSTSSEGVVVEGKNSVTLNNVTMEATNTKLNGNSETYKSIKNINFFRRNL